MRALVWSVLVVAVLGTATAGDAEAQSRRRPRARPRVEQRAREPRVYLGLALIGAAPQGDFADRADEAVGAQLDATVPLAMDGALRLRGELGGMIYGHEHEEGCFPAPVGCRIELDLDTDNAIFFAGLGPEIARPGVVSPYANATLGVSYFTTYSSVGTSGDRFARTEHFSDAVPAGRAGGGVRVELKRGRFPLLVDLGVRYHWNGVAEYLVEGDIVDEPDGSLSLFPNETEANLVAFQVGVAVGLGRRRPDADDERRRRR